VIERVRTEKPHEYLRVVASLVPKQLEFDGLAQPFALIPAEIESAEAWEASVSTRVGVPGVGEKVR
jgi:hypothetical protein